MEIPTVEILCITLNACSWQLSSWIVHTDLRSPLGDLLGLRPSHSFSSEKNKVSKQIPHFSNVKKAFSPKVLELRQLRYHVKTTQWQLSVIRIDTRRSAMVTFTINNMKIAYPPSSDDENSRWVQGVWTYDFQKGVHRNGHFLQREMDKGGPQWSLSLVKNFLSKAVYRLVKVCFFLSGCCMAQRRSLSGRSPFCQRKLSDSRKFNGNFVP